MSPLAFYVETSVWGSLGGRQPQDRTQVVHRLLRLLDGVRGTCVISDVVLAEIRDAMPDEAKRMRRHIDRVRPVVHPINASMELLARAYLEAGVLPVPFTLRRQPALSWIIWSVGTIGT